MRILPDKQRYIKGYVYFGLMGPVAYTPEEMVWLHYFNPLEEYAGLSPIAPLRLSADMGLDSLKFNRNFFKNSAQPDLIFTTEEAMSDEEVEDFYQRWDKRYKGPGNAHRPAIASFIKDIKTLGPQPPGDRVYPGPALEPGGREPGIRRAHAPAVRLPAGPSPTSTRPNASSGATPCSRR